MNIGLLGFGNIAQAFAMGLSKKKNAKIEHIYASDIRMTSLKKQAEALKVEVCFSNEELVEKSDLLFICIKPDQVKKALKPLNLENKIIVSFAAGIFFEDLEEIIPDTHHITMIPNTAMSVTEGIFVAENEHSLDAQQLKTISQVLSKIGMIEFVDTKKMDIATVVAGCAPAFTAMFIEALADGACRYGLDRQTSYRLASKMVEGTGKMANIRQVHPGVLKDEVCSPKGSTIKGVTELEKEGFRGAIIEAIDEIMDD